MLNDALNIRLATLADLPILLDLYQHLVPGDERAAQEDASRSFNSLMKMEGSAVFLGQVGADVATSCTLVVIPNLTRGGRPYALIENVVTHMSYRKRGFGNCILDAAVEAARQAQCYKVMLLTGSKNPETLSFYRTAGFEQSKTGFQKRL